MLMWIIKPFVLISQLILLTKSVYQLAWQLLIFPNINIDTGEADTWVFSLRQTAQKVFFNKENTDIPFGFDHILS